MAVENPAQITLNRDFFLGHTEVVGIQRVISGNPYLKVNLGCLFREINRLNHRRIAGNVLRRAVTEAIFRGVANCDILPTRPLKPLSPREEQVWQLMIEGASNRQIKRELHLSLPTVTFYVGQVKRKWDAKNSYQAVAIGANLIKRQGHL